MLLERVLRPLPKCVIVERGSRRTDDPQVVRQQSVGIETV